MIQLITPILTDGFPFIAGLYSFWMLSRKDGFDQEKVFDLVILGIAGGEILTVIPNLIISGRMAITWELIHNVNPFAFVLGFVITLCLLSLKWRWSVYRILDGFSISLILTMAFWLLLRNITTGVKPVYIVSSAVLITVYYLLKKYRLQVLKSAFTFSIVSGVFCIAGMLSSPQLINLIFLGLLFTLTLVILILRIRGLYGRHKQIRHTTNNS